MDDIELDKKEVTVGVIGLGYVGLPLAIEFGKRLPTVGYDKNELRIAQLRDGMDRNLECSTDDLLASANLTYTSSLADLTDCTVYIVTVPTPIDSHKQPDLTPLRNACEDIGMVLNKNNVVVFESTVFPGATEEICVPILERVSGLTYNRDFFVGYSPERINPGDREHRVVDILKVTSGSTPETADFVDRLYRSIVRAGTFRAASIRVAEAAKVIENTQRDVNIALVNELAMLFHRLGLDTDAVLAAARTKWNFLPFRPGLVGGHCIGVDPYYLTYKAQEVGHHPEMILAGRRINDQMGEYIAQRVVTCLTHRRVQVSGARILVLGITFKENCPDLRNSRVADLINELRRFDAAVDVYDPWVDVEEALSEYGIRPIDTLPKEHYDGIVLAVAHREFVDKGVGYFRRLCKPNGIIFDIKAVFPESMVDGRL